MNIELRKAQLQSNKLAMNCFLAKIKEQPMRKGLTETSNTLEINTMINANTIHYYTQHIFQQI